MSMFSGLTGLAAEVARPLQACEVADSRDG